MPSITSVERIDENTLRLTWQIDQDENSDLLRYRIFFSRENDDSLYEWPGEYQYTFI